MQFLPLLLSVQDFYFPKYRLMPRLTNEGLSQHFKILNVVRIQRIAIRTTTALAQMATAPMVSIAIAHRQHAVDTDTKQPQRAAIF